MLPSTREYDPARTFPHNHQKIPTSAQQMRNFPKSSKPSTNPPLDPWPVPALTIISIISVPELDIQSERTSSKVEAVGSEIPTQLNSTQFNTPGQAFKSFPLMGGYS